MQQLPQRANQLIRRLTDWAAQHPDEKWVFQVKIVLDVIAFSSEPPLPLVGSPNPINVEANRARRRDLVERVVNQFQEHNDFDWELAADISALLQDYAAAEM